MEYSLINTTETDKEEIYSIKKKSIRKYVEKIWGWDENYQRDDFEKTFISQNFKIIRVAHKNIGFVEIQETENTLNITEIHIDSQYQNQGIGSDILREIVNVTSKLVKSVIIGCFKENIKAIKLYKRIGFVVKEETGTHIIFRYEPHSSETSHC